MVLRKWYNLERNFATIFVPNARHIDYFMRLTE